MINEKANYEAKLIHSYSYSKSYKIFCYISTLKGHAGLPAEMCYGEQRVTDDLEKANLFNEYFFSVFLKDSNLKFTCPPTGCNNNTQSLRDIEISTTEVFEILSTLDVNKAPGIDGISPAVLKYCASPLLVPLCHLFTCSISSGRIPTMVYQYIVSFQFINLVTRHT